MSIPDLAANTPKASDHVVLSLGEVDGEQVKQNWL
jgi:hypothetical protein